MRIEGWESKLASHVEAAQKKTFAWGVDDCCLNSAEWVFKATGIDFFSDWKGQYDSEESALALIRERGYTDVPSIPDAHLTITPLMLARRGDLLLHPSGALGICVGLKGMFLTSRGVIAAKTTSCVRAWRVD